MSDGSELQLEEDKEKKEKLSYVQMEQYEQYLDFYLNSGKTFSVEQTTYTKKLKVGGKTIMFNQSGESDFVVLALINKVRTEAKKWSEKNPMPKLNENDIFWSRLTERPPNTVITKVDLNSAYWQCALHRKVITDRTDEYLVEKYSDKDERKQARVKALGALATKKQILYYTNGEQYNQDWKIEKTRELYMFICQSIDQLMSEMCINTAGAFFYYWDCIFTGLDTTDEIVNFMKEKGYASSEESVEQTIEQIGNHHYIVCTEMEKVFLKRKEENPDTKIKIKEYAIKPNDLFYIGNESKYFKKR